jgi:hypothetical protein
MAFFRAKTQDTVAAVRQKLDAAQTELASAQQRLTDRALDIALSTDPWEGEKEHDAIRRAEEKVRLFEMALAAAEAAEQQRLATVRAAERKSELRAIRQHIGRLLDGALAYEIGVQKSVDGFDRMLEAANAIRRLLPGDQAGENLRSILSYSTLHRAGQTELNRVGVGIDAGGRSSAPGTTKTLMFQPKLTPPLKADLERRLLGAFSVLSGEAPPPPIRPPEPVEQSAELEMAPMEQPSDSAPVEQTVVVQALEAAARELANV